MNFKFTKIKTIVSIIISTIVGIYFLNSPIYFTYFTNGAEGLIYNFIGFALRFMATFILIYLIWSLFEKREGESELSKTIGFILSILILLGMGYLIFYLLTTVFH